MVSTARCYLIIAFTLVISLLTIDAVPVLVSNENENIRQPEAALSDKHIDSVAVIVPPQPIRQSREAKPIFGLFGEPVRFHHRRPHHFGNGYYGDGYNGYGGGCGYNCGGGGGGGGGSYAGASAFSGSNSYGGYPGGSGSSANAQSSSLNFQTPLGNFGASSSYASSQSNSFRK